MTFSRRSQLYFLLAGSCLIAISIRYANSQFVGQNQQQQSGAGGGFSQSAGNIFNQQQNSGISSSSRSGGNLDFLEGYGPSVQHEGFSQAQGDRFRMSSSGFTGVDWMKIDRRAEEGWWHLYPFGERFNDLDMSSRPWNDQQIDLDFFFPFYGFRFNYTFIFPEGFLAFAYPEYIQPPYTFPNPGWPQRQDPSLIAAFMSAQTFMHVGETRLSHVWWRIIQRPLNMIGRNTGHVHVNNNQAGIQGSNIGRGGVRGTAAISGQTEMYGNQVLKQSPGRVEDPDMLDQITHDIQTGMIGARGFTADYALQVTWERMAYGGSPKSTRLNEYEHVKKSQNTYQMVIASDEIRSYTMFNYAHINWTSSTSAGSLAGRGGKQSALVGFNGGNGTGFVSLPYSAEGNSYKLVQFGSTQTAGRWLARVDEAVIYGGCTNTSTGTLRPHHPYVEMLGGFSLNVSGPCFRPGQQNLKLQIDELTVDCEKIDMVVARCVIPVNSIFRTGYVKLQLSVDGGKNYPFWNYIYVLTPSMSRNQLNLINDPLNTRNNWMDPTADNLTMTWSSYNISSNPNAQVDISLWGYWEDVEGHEFREIGELARQHPNTGAYSFNPRQLTRGRDKERELRDVWKRFTGGVLQVRVSENWKADRGDGLYWSIPVSFGWYFRQIWEHNYGKNWALDICRKWFDYDGRLRNFVMELEPKISCPCTMGQAEADFGRFTPLQGCNAYGNSECRHTRGAWHCVISTQIVWTGSAQMCCYDRHGWLMFTDDYEYNDQYLRFYAAGFPLRAHPWGSYPYKRPPYVPTMSNFYNDILPFEFCCHWASKCEFFYWRRGSSGCQNYKPPKLGYGYGEGHFITYDGLMYQFAGKGYYVLSMMKGPRHDLMVQAMMEQPPRTIWDEEVRATVITGVAARDNQSSTIQVFARKEFRRWRYKTDLYVDGIRVFLDMPFKKYQNFRGVNVFSPDRNMNMSEIHIMFTTGVGIKVTEARGTLNVEVSLPPSYNETLTHPEQWNRFDSIPTGADKCSKFTRSMGLLGTFNDDISDDLVTPDCQQTQSLGRENRRIVSENEKRSVYYDFGKKWAVDGVVHPLLFQLDKMPLYDPSAFASMDYEPIFDANQNRVDDIYTSLIFDKKQVTVQCQGVPSCEFDYITSGRREMGMETLKAEKKFEGNKERGEAKLISCGPLMKNRGVIKYPIGNNYLDGVTVTFTCKPEYFLHGDQQRTCINGTWSPGWWVWCRERPLEQGLKWLTGLITSFLIILAIALIFIWCYCMRIKGDKTNQSRRYRNQATPAHIKSSQPIGYPPPPQDVKFVNSSIPVMELEPSKVGIHGQHRFAETTA